MLSIVKEQSPKQPLVQEIAFTKLSIALQQVILEQDLLSMRRCFADPETIFKVARASPGVQKGLVGQRLVSSLGEREAQEKEAKHVTVK